jgi:hypothetical protein
MNMHWKTVEIATRKTTIHEFEITRIALKLISEWFATKELIFVL